MEGIHDYGEISEASLILIYESGTVPPTWSVSHMDDQDR